MTNATVSADCPPGDEEGESGEWEGEGGPPHGSRDGDATLYSS